MSTSKVYIPHEEFVWVAGQIVVDADSKGNVQVKIQDEALPQETGTKTISLAKYGLPSLPQQNIEVPAQGVEDMTKLNYLHEPSILDNLKRRFSHKLPYTYTGEVCVAINPYQWLPLYTDKLRETYSQHTRHELPPHVYATSTDAYRGLTIRAKNQSILVTGESGAGKTETVKILMGHLAYIAGKSDDKTIDKLLKANPLMETFGNAKTGRNDNSSRFGKFSQLEFDSLYVLVGSRCVTYLLEKSRVITQTKLERNYHIMYQLLASPDSVRAKLILNGKTCEDFIYTSSGDTKTNVIEGMTDSDRYNQTVQGLELLGVGPKLRSLLEQTIAGILHMGQVNFHAANGSADASSITAPNDQYDESTIACCRMLGVDPDIFATSVVSRVIEVEGKKLNVPLNVEQAASGRDALAKEIYSRIFNWLVLIINFNTSFSTTYDEIEDKSRKARGGVCSTISLLDIFGFECFAKNGFEQFCINFASEKLQQRFTQDVFMTVQREYQEEGLPWEIIKYKDNQDTLDMIEGRLGIVDLLNEECQIPKGTDPNFLAKIKTNFAQHYAFSSDQRARDNFTVRHYAGQVTYTITGFMDANKDAVPNNLETLLGGSKNIFVKRLFAETFYFKGDTEILMCEHRSTVRNILLLTLEESEKETISFIVPSITNSAYAGIMASRANVGRKVRNAVASFVVSEKILTKFKNQLASLMEMVNATDVQYVRTIKPNPNKSSTEYNRRMVVEQLRSAGMIEAVRISRAAFPNRLSYADFMNRFHLLRSKSWHTSVLKNLQGQTEIDQNKGLTKAFLSWLVPNNKKDLNDGTGTTEHYAFGNTKVYFTSFVLEKLESARNNIVFNSVSKMQKAVRGFLARRRFKKMKVAIRILRRFVCIVPDRMKLIRMRRAIIKIQSFCSMLYVRKRFRPIRDQYRKDRDIKKAQSQLDIDLNLEVLRAKGEEDRKRRKAEAEAARQRAIEEKIRIAEEARREEEERIRLIEEARLAEEAKMRYYESLEAKCKQLETVIEDLERGANNARLDIEQEKARSMDIQVQLDEALHEIASLKSSEQSAKVAVDHEKSKYRQLDTKLVETLSKIAMLERVDKASKTEIDEYKARVNLVEMRLASTSERLIASEQSELSLKSQLEEHKTSVSDVEAKLRDANEKLAAYGSTEKSLKAELEETNERLNDALARVKKNEATIDALQQNEAGYVETIASEAGKAALAATSLAAATAQIATLQLVQSSANSLKEENARLLDTLSGYDAANETITAMRLKEMSLKSELAAERASLTEALAKIEELEKRTVGPPADGTSVLSGLNDMEIVIDEDHGKMKVIITKRRPEGTDNALGAVEKYILN